MKKVFAAVLAAAMLMTALVGCSGEPTVVEKTAEELAQIYTDAIAANGGEMAQYNPAITEAKEDDGSAMLLEMMGLKAEDMKAFAISASMMNVQAYGIAAVMPAEGKEETVKTALQGFIDLQKTNFEFYLADQYEVAQSAKLETLEDGTVLMVMCQGQDEVFQAISEAIQAAYAA